LRSPVGGQDDAANGAFGGGDAFGCGPYGLPVDIRLGGGEFAGLTSSHGIRYQLLAEASG
jgi:hypothetical protein